MAKAHLFCSLTSMSNNQKSTKSPRKRARAQEMEEVEITTRRGQKKTVLRPVKHIPRAHKKTPPPIQQAATKKPASHVAGSSMKVFKKPKASKVCSSFTWNFSYREIDNDTFH